MLTDTLEKIMVENYHKNSSILHELAHCKIGLVLNEKISAAQIHKFDGYFGAVFPPGAKVSRGFYAAGCLAQQSYAAAFSNPHAIDNLSKVSAAELDVERLLNFDTATRDDLAQWLNTPENESDQYTYQMAWDFGLSLFSGLDAAANHLQMIYGLLTVPNMVAVLDRKYFQDLAEFTYPEKLAVAHKLMAA